MDRSFTVISASLSRWAWHRLYTSLWTKYGFKIVKFNSFSIYSCVHTSTVVKDTCGIGTQRIMTRAARSNGSQRTKSKFRRWFDVEIARWGWIILWCISQFGTSSNKWLSKRSIIWLIIIIDQLHIHTVSWDGDIRCGRLLFPQRGTFSAAFSFRCPISRRFDQ